MNRRFTTLLAALGLALGTIQPAVAQHGGGKHGGHGMGHLMHSLPSPHMGLATMRELGLELEQVRAISQIQKEIMSKHVGMKAELREIRWKLQSELDADRPDPERVHKLFGQLFDARQDMIRDRVEAANQVRDNLTEEQADHFREMKRSMGPGQDRQHRHHGGQGK
jgi:Spy/CpxP family protein refolding chaperone